MILYFSATGNSLYVARHLAAEGERLVSIPEALDHEIYEYDLEPGENLGCLHRCPKFAIQCGDKTKIHGQYQHSA